jgi:hypothetical protein
MNEETATVLLPRHPPRSRGARTLGWIALPLFALVIGIDVVLTGSGMPPAQRPPIVRVVLVLLIAGPGLLWLFAPRLAGLPGFGWLADRRALSLALDASGLTLRRGDDERTVPWADVSRLLVFEGSQPSAELVLASGDRMRLPSELVLGHDDRGRQTTLLDAIDRYRPQLANVDARRRQGAMISVAIVGILAVLGLIGALVLLSR